MLDVPLWIPFTFARSETIAQGASQLTQTEDSCARAFDSQIIQPEKSWTLTATKKGEFAYICTFHPTMKAMLHVQ